MKREKRFRKKDRKTHDWKTKIKIKLNFAKSSEKISEEKKP